MRRKNRCNAVQSAVYDYRFIVQRRRELRKKKMKDRKGAYNYSRVRSLNATFAVRLS